MLFFIRFDEEHPVNSKRSKIKSILQFTIVISNKELRAIGCHYGNRPQSIITIISSSSGLSILFLRFFKKFSNCQLFNSKDLSIAISISSQGFAVFFASASS